MNRLFGSACAANRRRPCFARRTRATWIEPRGMSSRQSSWGPRWGLTNNAQQRKRYSYALRRIREEQTRYCIQQRRYDGQVQEVVERRRSSSRDQDCGILWLLG